MSFKNKNTKNELEELEKKILEEERNRKEFEKYRVKKIKLWTKIGPAILGAVVMLLAIKEYGSYKDVSWYVLIPLIIIFGTIALASEIEGEWELRLKRKQRLYEENKEFEWCQGYEYDYIYFDSPWYFFTYRASKILNYLVSFLVLGILSILLFEWLGNVSIAPTTIIIILLIIIIINQNKTKDDE